MTKLQLYWAVSYFSFDPGWDADGPPTPVYRASDVDAEIERLRAALRKFGQHPTGDMEGDGACSGFRKAAPFLNDQCDCGLNAALASSADKSEKTP